MSLTRRGIQCDLCGILSHTHTTTIKTHNEMRPSWKYAQHLAPTVVPQSNYESPKKHINNINCNLKLIVLLLSLDHPKGFGSQNFGPKNQWQTKSVSPQYLHIFSSSHLLPGQAHTCTRPDGRGVQVRIRVKFSSNASLSPSANQVQIAWKRFNFFLACLAKSHLKSAVSRKSRRQSSTSMDHRTWVKLGQLLR